MNVKFPLNRTTLAGIHVQTFQSTWKFILVAFVVSFLFLFFISFIFLFVCLIYLFLSSLFICFHWVSSRYSFKDLRSILLYAFLKYQILLFVANPSVIWKGRLTKHAVWLPTRRCDERNFCSLNAKLDALEEDPCPETEKYLEAHYVCHSLIDGPPTQGWSKCPEK